MMRGEAAGDEVKAAVGEGEILGLRVRGGDIGEALGLGEFPRLGQHRLGDVAGNDLGDVRGEGERGVTGAGRDIEHAPMVLRLGQRDEKRERLALGMHGGRGVVGGGGSEFLLDEGGHVLFAITSCGVIARLDRAIQ